MTAKVGLTDALVIPPRHLVALLAAFTSLVILTTDVYLPVLPQLGRDLGTSDAAAAATVSAVLIGIAVGQVLVGPLSDAFGRRAPLLLGALAYAITHVLAAAAPNIAVLLGLRVVGGLATAACIVVARAIVADLFPGEASARAFATLSAVTAIVPVLAPVSGGLLAHVMSWRGMFLLLAALAVALTVVGARALPETLPADLRSSPHFRAVATDLLGVLRNRRFLAHVGAMAAVGGVLFGYIGSSAFVLQKHFGMSPQAYSLTFAGNSVGIFVVAQITRSLVVRVGARRLLTVGQVGTIAGTVVLALGVGLSLLPVVLLGLLVTISACGFVMPMTASLGLAESRGRAGSASGLLGIAQFTVGAACSPLAGIGGSPWSLVAVLATAAVAGLVIRVVLTSTSRATSGVPA